MGFLIWFRVDLYQCWSYLVIIVEERYEVTCWVLFLVRLCVLVFGVCYVLLSWFFFKVKWLENAKGMHHHRN